MKHLSICENDTSLRMDTVHDLKAEKHENTNIKDKDDISGFFLMSWPRVVSYVTNSMSASYVTDYNMIRNH